MTDEEIEKILGSIPNIDMLVHQALLEVATEFIKEGRASEVPVHILEQHRKICR